MEKAIMPALTGRHYIAVTAVLIVVLSWIGALDTASEDYVNSSIVQASAAFASARALNAVISVLQSTELSMMVASMTVGEALDPLNDLIEQYSTMMKYAIASLLVQKLLLAITSSTVFKVFLTIAAVVAAATALMGRERLFSFLFRVFVFFAFLRFALVLVVGLNGLVSSYFVNEQIDTDLGRLQATTEAVEKVSGDQDIDPKLKAALTSRRDQFVSERERITADKVKLEAGLVLAQQELYLAGKELEAVRGTMNPIEKLGSYFSNDESSQEALRVGLAQDSVNDIEARISQLNDEVEAINEGIAAVDDQLQGKAASWFEAARNAAGAAVDGVKENFTGRISGLVDTLSESVSNFLDLMAAFVLKTLILPLIFLYMIVMLTKAIWNIDVGRNVKL